MWEIGCELERSTKETLSTDKQKEICLFLCNHNIQVITSILGHMAVLE